MKFKTRKTWKNVAGNQTAQPRTQYWPENLDDIIEIIKEAEKHELQVRPLGSSHSWSDVGITPDFLVRPERLNKVLRLDTSVLKDADSVDPSKLVHVESGISVRELNKHLDANGLALLNMGGYDGQTFVGAMSTSTHGSGVSFGPFSDFVQSFELVSDGGTVYRIEPHDGISDPAKYEAKYPDIKLVQDDDKFNAAIVSMGCMGVIYSIILRVKKKYWLTEVRTLSTWDEVKADLKRGDVLRDNRHYEVLLNPHKGKDGRHKALITTRNPADPKEGRTISQKSRSFVDAVIDSLPLFRRIAIKIIQIVSIGLVKLYKLIPELKDDGIDAALDGLEDKDGYFDISYKVFNIGIANEIPAISSEIGFPLTDDKYIEAIDRFLHLAEENRTQRELYHTAPVSLRFVKGSDAFLSMMHGYDTCMIEIIMAKDTRGTFEMMERYETELYKFSGRPHWGQVNSLKASDDRIRSLYPEFDKWIGIYKKLNKNGTFDGPFTKRVGFPKETFTSTP